MKNSIIIFSALTVLVILFGCSSGVQSLQQEEKPAKSDYYVAAYIWPSCHDDSLGREKLWTEGSYLLPDMLNGFGYLEAVKEVIIDGKYDRY